MTGFQFWTDLVFQFGPEAKEVAERYLALPMYGVEDTDAEDEFCGELCIAANIEPTLRPRV